MKLFKGCEDGVHEFEPRYDKGEPRIPIGHFDAWGEELERYRRIIYVRDVCVRCGKTIEREAVR